MHIRTSWVSQSVYIFQKNKQDMAVHISLYVRRHTSRFVYFKLISRAYVLRLMPFIQFLEIFKTNTWFSAGRLRALWNISYRINFLNYQMFSFSIYNTFRCQKAYIL